MQEGHFVVGCVCAPFRDILASRSTRVCDERRVRIPFNHHYYYFLIYYLFFVMLHNHGRP